MNKNSKAVKLFLALSMVTAITACNNVTEQKDGGEEGGALPTDNAPASVEQQPNPISANDGQESGEEDNEGQESGEEDNEGQESGEQADEGQESGEQADDGQESGEADKVKKVPGNR